MFYPSLVMAILAATVASQTMITGTFQLLSQIIKLSYFPQIKIIHTSTKFHNQIYIPWVNWLLMIGTICVTAAYSNTTKLGEAYGVCVILVTFITTCMVSVVALVVWQLNVPIVAVGFVIFGLLDGLYLSSALTKVPDGAWFTLLLAVLLSSIFALWRFGKENQWRAESSDRIPPRQLLMQDTNPGDSESGDFSTLLLRPNKAPVSRLRGVGIFFDKTGSPYGTPAVFIHFLQKFQAAPSVVVFFHIRPLSTPTVAPEDRFTVSRCSAGSSGPQEYIPNFYRVTIRHGYLDLVLTSNLSLLIYENIRNLIIQEGAGLALNLEDASSGNSNTSTTTKDDTPNPPLQGVHLRQEKVRQNLAALQAAYEEQVVHIVGKEQMRIDEVKHYTGYFRKIALAAFLWLRSNVGNKVANMNLDVEKLVEVGFVKTI